MDRLRAILEHVETINERMANIHQPADFRSKNGSLIFDAILIRLQALGENIKKIEEIEPGFVADTLSLDVDNIIRFRDIISHHYDKLDTEIIYDIILLKLPDLKSAVEKHLKGPNLLQKKAPKLIEKRIVKGRGKKL